MTKTIRILTALLISAASGYAVTITGVLTGSPGSTGTNVTSQAALSVSNATVTGGAAITNAPAGYFLVDGNDALTASNVDSITLTNSSFSGSPGGSADITSVNRLRNMGGTGMKLQGMFHMIPLQDGLSFTGGDGGTGHVGTGRGRSYGGDGLRITSTATFDLVIQGGLYSGGKGGLIDFNSNEVNNPDTDLNAASYLGEYFGAIGGFLGARGGYGLRIYNEDYVPYGSTVTIDDGTFSGGNGGVSENTNSTGDSNADGGHAIYADFINLEINGGDFHGGTAGTANGVPGNDGYGVRLRDSTLTITDGNFPGQGLSFESHYYNSSAGISGGTFGTATVIARYDEFFYEGRTSTINISGGSFSNLQLMADDDSVVDATVNGADIGSLEFLGTPVSAAVQSVIGASTTVSNVYQNGGTAHVLQWSDPQFADTVVSNGTLHFDNQLFSMPSGSTFALKGAASAVYFNNGLTMQSGSTLHLGTGTAFGPEITAQSGSEITSVYDGSDMGSIQSSGTFSLAAGTLWSINAGSNTVTGGQTFTLATAPAITCSLTADDITLLGTGGEFGGYGQIVLVSVVGNALIATYGVIPETPTLNLDSFYESYSGQPVTIDATPTGGYPPVYTYQWFFDGVPVSPALGGTNSAYAISGESGNNGTWRVDVSNSTGTTSVFFEYRVFEDQDGDGLSDYREIHITLTDPDDADSDDDGLDDFEEVVIYLTNPNAFDSDNDGFDDGTEVLHNLNPLVSDDWILPYITNNAEAFGFNCSTGVIDVAVGQLLLETTNGEARLSIQLEQSEDLVVWTNAGEAVEWIMPVENNKQFFRVRTEP